MEMQKSSWHMGFLNRGYTELSPISCGWQACPPLHTGYGRRPYYMIHYVIKGKGTLHCEDGDYPAEQGQIFLVLPQEDAHYTADGEDPWEYIWICFSGTLAQKLDAFRERVFKIPYYPFGMVRSLENRTDTREEFGAAALFLIFSELFSGRPARPHYVRRTVDTINSLYMTPVTVESIAANLGIDRRYLSRIFKANMGISVQEYLIQVRMEQAEKLLQDKLPVNLVCELVGYSDPFHFSKMFKKYYGVSPSLYKKNRQ